MIKRIISVPIIILFFAGFVFSENDPPSLSSPLDGAILNVVDPVFSWQSVFKADD